MAKYEVTESCKISAVNTSDQYQTFDGGIQKVYMVSDADVFIDFDRPASTTSSLLLKANMQPTEINFDRGTVMTVHAKTGTGSANVYLMGIRH